MHSTNRSGAVIITLGFNESDGVTGYINVSDGYRPGAGQMRVTVVPEGYGRC